MTKNIDSSVEFQPINRENFLRKSFRNLCAMAINLALKKMKKDRIPLLSSYKGYVDFQIKKQPYKKYNYKRYPSVAPQWDNSPRRKNKYFFAFTGSTPALFKKWLKHTYDRFIPYSKDENFIFINAWNEWAEGCHLEPDLRNGRGYLEAVKEVTSK